jgi:hypothetical protein
MWQRCLKNRTRVCAYVSGFVILADGLYLVILELLLLATTSLRGKLFGWTSGDWTQERWDRMGQRPPHFGVGGSLVWKFPWWAWSGPCPYAKHTLAFSLQLRKIAGSLGFVDLFFYSWGSQIESGPRHRLSWLRSRYFPQSLENKAGTVLYLYENRHMRIYCYVRSHIILHQMFGHSCDHHHGVTQQEYNQYTNNCKKYMISSSFIIHFCTAVCILIVMLQDTLMMVTEVAETCGWKIICDRDWTYLWMSVLMWV